MSSYITTNIRLPEEDYLSLKEEAAKKRKSFAAVVRDKISAKSKKRSKVQIERLLLKTEKLAEQNAKHLKGVDIVKVLREMRKPRWQ